MGNGFSCDPWLHSLCFRRLTAGMHPQSPVLTACTPGTMVDIFLYWDMLKTEYKVGHVVIAEEFTGFARRHFRPEEVNLIFRLLGTNPHRKEADRLRQKQHVDGPQKIHQPRHAPVATLKVDMFEVLSLFAITSPHLSDASKVRFLFALFDYNKDQTISQPEVVLMFLTVLRVISKLVEGDGQKIPIPSDMELHVKQIYQESLPVSPSRPSALRRRGLQSHPGIKIGQFQIWAHSNSFAQSLLNAFRSKTRQFDYISLPDIKNETKSMILTHEEIHVAFKLWLYLRNNVAVPLSECVHLVAGEQRVRSEGSLAQLEARVSDEGGNFVRLVRKNLGKSLRLRYVLQVLSPGASQADLNWYVATLEATFKNKHADPEEAKAMEEEIEQWKKLPLLPWQKRLKYAEEFRKFDKDGDGFLTAADLPAGLLNIDQHMKISVQEYEAYRNKMASIRAEARLRAETPFQNTVKQLGKLANVEPDDMVEPDELSKYHSELYRELTVISEVDMCALTEIFDLLSVDEPDGERRVQPSALGDALPPHLLNALFQRYDLCQRGLTLTQFLEMCLVTGQRLPLKPNPSKMPRYFGTFSAAAVAGHWKKVHGTLCRRKFMEQGTANYGK
eukprot:GEMP01021885.1.p1 GENE.GEMP01021885.1~~GEMP01021885.1.p1  ORF type:complete len:616 (+),score=111.48 GEMP01021885.1:283-2130(+)